MADEESTSPTEGEGTATAPEPQQVVNVTPEVPPEVKRALSKANKEAETLRLRLKEFEDRDKTDHEREIEKARQEADKAARADVATAYQRRILTAEVKAAANAFADPADAVLHVNLDDIPVDADGNADPKAVAKAVADVLAAKPYLAAQQRNGSLDLGRREGTPPVDDSPRGLIAAGLAETTNHPRRT